MVNCMVFRVSHNRQRTLAFVTAFWCLVFLWVNMSYTNQELLRWITLSDGEPKDLLLNEHQFEYSLNTDICQTQRIDIIVVVHTAVNNFLRRMKSRDTWAGITQIDQHSTATVFMVGLTTDAILQHRLWEESQFHKDIVQGNFIDSYQNLTYKHIMALGWVNSHCPTVKLIVKSDDDVLVNLFNIAAYIYKYGFQSNFLYCVIYNIPFPKRIAGNKWYVRFSDYPFMLYPVFCSGAGYLVSPDTAIKLFDASSDIRFFWIDDLYITGFLMLKLGIKHTSMVPGHDFVNSSSLTKDAMFLDAQNIWYTQWDYIVKSLQRTCPYKTTRPS